MDFTRAMSSLNFGCKFLLIAKKYNSGQKETKIGNGERKRNGRKRERAFSLPLGHHSSLCWWWGEGCCLLFNETFRLKNEWLCNFLYFWVDFFHLRVVWFKANNEYLKLSFKRQALKSWHEMLLNLVNDCLTLLSIVRTLRYKVYCCLWFETIRAQVCVT